MNDKSASCLISECVQEKLKHPQMIVASSYSIKFCLELFPQLTFAQWQPVVPSILEHSSPAAYYRQQS